MERDDISAWRSRYLQVISNNDKAANPLPLVYLDETYIHSSHTSGKCWQGEGTEGVLEPVSKGQRFIIVHAGEITVEEWIKHCNHVRKLQNEYLDKGGYLDEPFIINVLSDSETDSDSEDDYLTGVSSITDHDYDVGPSTSRSVDHTYCKNI
ncbi:Uncharacterized protein OBRU01_07867 [Operophtera brumata]|uniref:Uncharacterized protein n=1 Tax=Operophtera brumata TaxID=104452 RepID=A0A0L7LAU6_OPEBR|nr:Uncharacterized protein OBRU01_07867 [Operophtera brumata]